MPIALYTEDYWREKWQKFRLIFYRRPMDAKVLSNFLPKTHGRKIWHKFSSHRTVGGKSYEFSTDVPRTEKKYQNIDPTVASVENHINFLPTSHWLKIVTNFRRQRSVGGKSYEFSTDVPRTQNFPKICVPTVASVENHMNFLPMSHGRKISRNFSSPP